MHGGQDYSRSDVTASRPQWLRLLQRIIVLGLVIAFVVGLAFDWNSVRRGAVIGLATICVVAAFRVAAARRRGRPIG